MYSQRVSAMIEEYVMKESIGVIIFFFFVFLVINNIFQLYKYDDARTMKYTF